MYRPARSEKVIGMTILGARVLLVLRAQAAYPGPANTHSPPPTRYPTIIGRTKVYDMIRNGELASIKIGKLRRVPVDAVREYARLHLIEAAQ